MYRDELQDVADDEEKLLNITIPPGVPPGTQITFPESGDQGPSVIPGKYTRAKQILGYYSYIIWKLYQLEPT